MEGSLVGIPLMHSGFLTLEVISMAQSNRGSQLSDCHFVGM